MADEANGFMGVYTGIKRTVEVFSGDFLDDDPLTEGM